MKNIIEITLGDESQLKGKEFLDIVETIKGINDTSFGGIELDIVINKPWGSYTPTKDGFFIPPVRIPYESEYIQAYGRVGRLSTADYREMKLAQTDYNILMNQIVNTVGDSILDEEDEKAVYQVKDRDAFFKCKKLDIFMTGHKGFIAGGCFKNIFSDQKIKDVDIFFESEGDWNEALNYYKSQTEDFSFVYENENATGFKHIKSKQKLEIIKSRFGKPDELIRDFDFTIAKFAYYKDKSNDDVEYKFIYHPDFFEHLTLKKLVMDESSLFPVNTFERSYKYQKYGFGMCRETKQKLLKLLQGANVEDVESSLYFGFD